MPFTPKILIVDDDPALADSTSRLLCGRGYDIHTAYRATDALKRLRSEHFHLALLDVMMPVMSGFDLMDAIDRETMETLFIVITGDESTDSAVQAIRRNACDYLKKPFEPDELLLRVENVLQRIAARQEQKAMQKKNRQLERQLRQSQKMEAIGTLAGGIAHDFNNILGIILGNVELAMTAADDHNPLRPNLEKIKAAGTRAKDLIAQLLSYTRRSEIETRSIDMGELVHQALKLMRASIPTHIDIQCPPADQSIIVVGDETQLNQILLNLCTNAAQSMETGGGTLTVRLAPITLTTNILTDTGELPAGEYARLTVVDTGPGIDPCIRERLFEPYFTTKQRNKGTGMGLAVVHGIVKTHEGAIRVKSEPGCKTAFQVYLPLADAPAEATPCDTAAPFQRGRGRILLVDDEPMIVDMMQQMLELMGYEVCAQTDSTRALALFRQQEDTFDLVVTDMAMPGIPGDRLAEKMKALRPRMPIVLCTGNDESLENNPQRRALIDEIVLKPVGMQPLAQTLHRLLENRGAERRAHQRYPVDGRAWVVSKAHHAGQGRLMDISCSGLSFTYVKNGHPWQPMESISITSGDRAFVLEDISYKTAWDHHCSGPLGAVPGTLRRRGGQFENLTPSQREDLTRFIQTVAIGDGAA